MHIIHTYLLQKKYTTYTIDQIYVPLRISVRNVTQT